MRTTRNNRHQKPRRWKDGQQTNIIKNDKNIFHKKDFESEWTRSTWLKRAYLFVTHEPVFSAPNKDAKKITYRKHKITSSSITFLTNMIWSELTSRKQLDIFRLYQRKNYDDIPCFTKIHHQMTNATTKYSHTRSTH